MRVLIKCRDDRKTRTLISGIYDGFIKNKENKGVGVIVDMNPLTIL